MATPQVMDFEITGDDHPMVCLAAFLLDAYVGGKITVTNEQMDSQIGRTFRLKTSDSAVGTIELLSKEE